jgi:hypothetical protein
MRNSHRRDSNHSEILDELRQAGFSVVDLSQVGNSCPDALVARYGFERLIEIKSGKKTLTNSQADWHASWRGPWPLVVRKSSDVIEYWGKLIRGEKR